jgi:hypothetical protein
MLTGKRFRLTVATFCIESKVGRRQAIRVPVDSVLKVLSGPRPDKRFVDVVWDQRVLEMFAEDLKERGVEI